MTITTIKAGQIVEAATLLLQREVVLPRLVWTMADANFRGALDDTVTLRVPAVLSSRTRVMRSSDPLVADNLAETSVLVKLATHIYNLLNITDEELTLDIVDFARQVLAPQMRAVAEGMEDVIADALAGATVGVGQTLTFDGTSTTGEGAYQMLVKAGAVLNNLKVPRANRVFLAGTNAEAALLNDDKLVKVNESGTTDALREATITRVAGFTVVGSLAIGPNEAYAFDRNAIAFANVAPALPDGATMKARVALDGLALRYIRDYNPTNATGPVDRSLVDSFVGAASVEQGGFNHRLVKITFDGTGPVSA